MKPTYRKSTSAVRKQFKELRALSNSSDPVEARIAQAMADTIVWATEETQGWKLAEVAKSFAGILKKELPTP